MKKTVYYDMVTQKLHKWIISKAEVIKTIISIQSWNLQEHEKYVCLDGEKNSC